MSEKPGSFAYDGLDRVLHEKARLGILTSLFSHPEGLVFGEIKRIITFHATVWVYVDGECAEFWLHDRCRSDSRLTEASISQPGSRVHPLAYVLVMLSSEDTEDELY